MLRAAMTKAFLLPSSRAALAFLIAASGAAARAQQGEPSNPSAPPGNAPAPTAPSGATPLPVDVGPPLPSIDVFQGQRTTLPLELSEKVKVDVRRRLARTTEQLGPNVVQLSIERRVGDGMFVSLQASGLVLDEAGHVITIGSTLQQAGRIAVHFANAPQFRPRRARLVGVDDDTDVGVLMVGPVRLPSLALAEAAPPPEPNSEQRYVVTISSVSDEPDLFVAAGWLHDPVPNFKFGQHQFDRLLRVKISRSPQCAGGILADQGGHVMGFMLAPAQMTGGAVPTDGMLALPAEVVQRGVKSVLARVPVAPADSVGQNGGFTGLNGANGQGGLAARARPWLGFGATELEEPEFLRQLGVAHAVVVSEIFEESPALKAGLEPHDVILAWNGEAVGGVDALYSRLAASEPGSRVALDCVRGLERRKVDVTLGAW